MMIMKRTALALTLIVTLLILVLAGALVVEVAEANPASMAQLFDNVVITVQSPQNITYTERTLPLNFTVETNNENQLKTRYILNNEKPVNVQTPVVSMRLETSWYMVEGGNNETFRFTRYTAQGNAFLSNLTDGTYYLMVQRYYGDSTKPEGATIINATTVSFTINTTASFERDSETVPFPDSLTLSAGIAVAAVVAFVCAGLLIDFRRRNHQREIGEQK